LYFINGTLGTPPQVVQMHLDTGSSDLWVNTPSSELCAEESNPCYTGTYAANSSSTYAYIGSYFSISYVDGSAASGDYVTDMMELGSAGLTDFQFGVGYESTSAQCILGIGYPINEVQVSRAGMEPYENLPAKMVSAGHIATPAYSLWLNDLDANRGEILFGGIDTEQYHGTLQTLPVQQNAGAYAEFFITMTALHLGGETVTEDKAAAVLLDSGSSLTYLPDSWVDEVYRALGVQWSNRDQTAYAPCSLANDTRTLDFDFSGVVIPVEMNEVVLSAVTADGQSLTFSDGTAACLFGVMPSRTGAHVLGDTFLRSAYVVYDLDGHEISLAPTRFFAANSDVRDIPAPGQVPDATRVADPVQATSGLVPAGGGGRNSEGEDDDHEGAAPPRLAGAASSLAVLVAFVFAAFAVSA
jgi:hypothetical protein